LIYLLVEAITERLSQAHQRCKVNLPASHGRLRASLYQKSVVKQESIADDGSFYLELELSKADLGWLKKQQGVEFIENTN